MRSCTSPLLTARCLCLMCATATRREAWEKGALGGANPASQPASVYMVQCMIQACHQPSCNSGNLLLHRQNCLGMELLRNEEYSCAHVSQPEIAQKHAVRHEEYTVALEPAAGHAGIRGRRAVPPPLACPSGDAGDIHFRRHCLLCGAGKLGTSCPTRRRCSCPRLTWRRRSSALPSWMRRCCDLSSARHVHLADTLDRVLAEPAWCQCHPGAAGSLDAQTKQPHAVHQLVRLCVMQHDRQHHGQVLTSARR